MLSRGKNKTLGNTYIHSFLYNRQTEFNESINNLDNRDSFLDLNSMNKLLLLNESHREEYKKIYKNRISEIKRFFERHDNRRLIHVNLEDDSKWSKIANHFDIKNYPDKVWENKSKK